MLFANCEYGKRKLIGSLLVAQDLRAPFVTPSVNLRPETVTENGGGRSVPDPLPSSLVAGITGSLTEELIEIELISNDCLNISLV